MKKKKFSQRALQVQTLHRAPFFPCEIADISFFRYLGQPNKIKDF
jgi:hypothetical protein